MTTPAEPPALPEPFTPMEGPPTIANTFDTLLKKPGSILHELHHGEPEKLVRNLLIVTLVCLAVFGLVVGLFSGGTQIWAAPMKIVLGVFASGLITLPSLYIFCCLNGLDVNGRSVVGVMTASLCLTALLLLGLTPVAWIFSQSTDSLAFMGFLTLCFWSIAGTFGLALIFRAARLFGVTSTVHLTIWAFIFILVTLQMSTSLRPIVGTSDEMFTSEKMFFLEHWVGGLEGRL